MNRKTIEVDLPNDAEIELVLDFGGFPTEWNITTLMQGSAEIGKDYIYLRNADFSPAPDNFTVNRETFVLTADIELPEGMIPVLFGTGTSEKVHKRLSHH